VSRLPRRERDMRAERRELGFQLFYQGQRRPDVDQLQAEGWDEAAAEFASAMRQAGAGR
jgi:hypothetical protein